ncbi:hypothetical protein IFM89_039660 [Coptis chinensis]|uniref:RING-type E3 ubiquitin transferase n=1 Tax=Coptis chinensis TaxID=261450 RepID=A0A835GVW6_9MAGN|nr:hypothetical protein IFM89_039660 [Coptis chinensis]
MADNTSSHTSMIDDYNNSNTSGSTERISGNVMIAAIVALFLVIVFILFLHLYAKWFWGPRGDVEDETHHYHTRRPRRRFVFAPTQDPTVALHTGLDPAVVRSLPVLVFHPDDFKDGLECAVCLSELSDGEKARLLPKCNHGYHVECIDMWFQSHSTCPLCRNTVSLVDSKDPSPQIQSHEEDSSSTAYSIDSPDFPTNVLFWGNQTLLSTRTIGQGEVSPSTFSSTSILSSTPRRDGGLMIEIPSLTDRFSSLSPSPSRFTEEEMKSPMTTRLRSLRRLLSRDKRPIPCSPSSVDVELGEGGRGQSSKSSPDS